MAVLLLAFTFLDGIKVSVSSRHSIWYKLSLV
jgi:C-8 sterol isomerase